MMYPNSDLLKKIYIVLSIGAAPKVQAILLDTLLNACTCTCNTLGIQWNNNLSLPFVWIHKFCIQGLFDCTE